jgi:bacteriocin-like protein
MIKLRFDRNTGHTEKAPDQKVAMPVEKELNEQELASVTGGWGGRSHHMRRHHHHHHHHHHRHHRNWDD